MILRRHRTQDQAFRGQDVVHARQTTHPVPAGRRFPSGARYGTARGSVLSKRTSCGEAMACRPDQRHFRLTVIVKVVRSPHGLRTCSRATMTLRRCSIIGHFIYRFGRQGHGGWRSSAYAHASQRTHHHCHDRRRTVLPHRQSARRRKPRRGLHSLGQARHQRRRPGQHLRRRAVPGPAAPGAARRPHPSRTRPVLRAQRAHRRPGDPQGAVRGRLHRPPPGHRLAAVSRARRTRRLHPDRTRPASQHLDRGSRALAVRPPALRALTGAAPRRPSVPAARRSSPGRAHEGSW